MAQYKVAPSSGSALSGETVMVEADAFVLDTLGLKFYRQSNLVAAFPSYAWMMLVEEKTEQVTDQPAANEETPEASE